MPAARIGLWVASVGGLALLARTLLVEPVPTWLAVTAFLAYAIYCTLGVIVPQLEMYGDVEWRAEPGARAVALTFDDGPNAKTTREVLSILARGGHRATFFVVGRKVEKNPELVRAMHEAGHGLGVHGYTHDRLYSFKPPRHVAEDIEQTRAAVEKACGVRPELFRPPVGYVSARTAAGAKRARARIIAWSVRALDGTGSKDVDAVLGRLERGLKDGAILLLHDAAERDDFEPASVAALPRLLELCDERGLATLTVEELLDGDVGGPERSLTSADPRADQKR